MEDLKLCFYCFTPILIGILGFIGWGIFFDKAVNEALYGRGHIIKSLILGLVSVICIVPYITLCTFKVNKYSESEYDIEQMMQDYPPDAVIHKEIMKDENGVHEMISSTVTEVSYLWWDKYVYTEVTVVPYDAQTDKMSIYKKPTKFLLDKEG